MTHLQISLLKETLDDEKLHFFHFEQNQIWNYDQKNEDF